MSTTVSHTFPREERLRGKADIAALMSHGQWSGEEHVRCCFRTGTGTGINRVMVSVPKKHFRRAVMRNLLKRRMEPGDYGKQDDCQNHNSYCKHLDELCSGEGLILPAAVVEHEHQRGDGQQVQEVHSNAEAHKESYQHYPAARMRLVSVVVPHGHGPEHKGSEERGHRIDFTLDRGEPECVGEAIYEGTYKAGTNYRYCLRDGVTLSGGAALA